MAVGTYALTSVDRLLDELQISRSELLTIALDVWADDSVATAATVSISLTGITIANTGGTVPGPTTLTWATYTTVTAVVVAIKTLAGWSARVQGVGVAASTDIEPLLSTACLTFDQRAQVEMVATYRLERVIDGATSDIEAYCGRQFRTRSYSSWLDGTGRNKFYLFSPPVTAVSRLSIGQRQQLTVEHTATDAARATVAVTGTQVTLVVYDAAGATTSALTFVANATLDDMATAINALSGWAATNESTSEIDEGAILSTDLRPTPALDALNDDALLFVPAREMQLYQLDEATGLLTGAWFPEGHVNVFVEYTGGFSVSTDGSTPTQLPQAIETACLRLAKWRFQRALLDEGPRVLQVGPKEVTLGARGPEEEAILQGVDDFRLRRWA